MLLSMQFFRPNKITQKKWFFFLSLKVTLKFVTLNLYQPLMITGNDSDPIKDNNNVDKIVSLSMSEIISGHFASISIL